MSTPLANVPGLSAPLRRALADVGAHSLADLDGRARTSIANLHGVGKVGLARLEAAMSAEGFALKDGHAVWSATDKGVEKAGTGTNSPDISTAATDADVLAFIDSLEPRRATQGRELLRIFGEVTGARPRMWGPSMVGYGELHYLYATGREGDMFRVGFSPRKASISLYGLTMYGTNDRLLDQLGKIKTGKSCVYVNKLEDIDEDVLRALIRRGFEQDEAPSGGTC